MEILGGFMVMFSVLAFFLAVVWLVFPFVVFAMKGKLDRVCTKLEEIEARLKAIENRLPPRSPSGRGDAQHDREENSARE